MIGCGDFDNEKDVGGKMAYNNKLILLGVYLAFDNKGNQCLQLAYDLEQEYGADKVIVLKGENKVLYDKRTV